MDPELCLQRKEPYQRSDGRIRINSLVQKFTASVTQIFIVISSRFRTAVCTSVIPRYLLKERRKGFNTAVSLKQCLDPDPLS